MATNFEREYMIQRHANDLRRSLEPSNGIINLGEIHNEMRLMLNFRELDRQSRELDKLIAELKQYKEQFYLEVKDEATKEIEKLIDSINRLGK